MISKKNIGKISAAFLTIMVMVYAGCANSPRPTSSPVPTNLELSNQFAPTVGLDVCVNCHAGQTTQWLKGQHANMQTLDPGTLIDLGLDNTGYPFYASGDWKSTCYQCHDPLGDGHRLTADWTGNTPRPVIGCESCHGGGANHFGIGPIPYPEPDHTRCGQCHNANFPHLKGSPDNANIERPNGANIVEDYSNSHHVQSTSAYGVLSLGGVNPVCSRCHSDEGFMAYKDTVPGTTGYTAIVAALSGQPIVANTTPVECHTCHDAHTTNAYPFPQATSESRITSIEYQIPVQSSSFDVNGKPQSREFNTCTKCHQLIGTNAQVMTDAFHDVDNIGGLAGSITPNHAAVPGDIRQNTGPSAVPVLFVRKADQFAENGNFGACSACHNPHVGDATINEQWIRSGHGDLTGDPWTHYNWKSKTKTSTMSDRKASQRCHTSTGFKNFANNPSGYNPANNDFSYLIFGTADGPGLDNGQNETLYCWACHTDYKGTRRNPGAIDAQYVYKQASGTTAEVVFPDIASSNVCIACHKGRESGGSIVISTSDFANTNFVNSHYLGAGGILFAKIGYEYYLHSPLYDNVALFAHDRIGLTAANTGSDGPCVGCHMEFTQEKHLFLPVTIDETTDRITAITSTVCAVCHTGTSAWTVDALNQERDESQDALAALADQLQTKRGYYYAPAHNPYFFLGPYDPTYVEATASPHCQKNLAVQNWQTLGTSTWSWNGSKCVAAAGTLGTPGTGKPNMGAAFNLQATTREVGSWVHNRFYTKRLIYDSIDWVDDGVLNDSVKTTLTAYPPATLFKAGALTYLLSDPSCTPNAATHACRS